MLTHRGFSAWVASNGKLLPEYLIAVDEQSHRVSCWIPGVEGHTFDIYWQDHGGKVDSCAFIILDGFVVPGRFLYGQGITSRGGVRASKSTERPFMFQKVPESATESPHRAGKEAGMITLKIKRIQRVYNRPSNAIQPLPAAPGKRRVGDLCIGFGEEVTTFEQHESTWSVVPYDKDGSGATKPRTYVSFVFRYRSPDFLEAQGISTDKPFVPKRIPSTRRISSLPPHISNNLESSPGQRKKSRHTPLALLGRPSSHPDPRRTMSCTRTHGARQEGQGQFFLSRNYSTPVMTKPGSTDTSESSGTDAT